MKNIKIIKSLLIVLLCFSAKNINAQNTVKPDVIVDENGVMRWGPGGEEVMGFGVNYSVPFAHAFRTGEKLEIDLKKAIDNDVYHFSRLGFDLFRIHVWDTEISDAEGNLLENEHLELFDYLLFKLKERNINYVITPIAYWGNGWPEPNEETPGFSHKYGKENSLINPEAIKAQENYLAQFLNHVNPLTQVAYKNEPNLIAFEISNEPHHREAPQDVTRFVQKMVDAMRSTGTKKPIFYNVTHSVHLADDYFKADIQGGTFQWYPTGLGFQKELEGNLLPNVDKYHIPFNDVFKKNNAAKLVYEFDAADVNKAYMYPAMARSFRSAGIQIATHFAYDPTYMANVNTEYNTHYMNLAYTPHKALALMISGKIFHEVPLNANYGKYPDNLNFGNFSINYDGDLAIYNSNDEFIYTNSNSVQPKSNSQLEKIAGFGNSEIIKYDGGGAYFFDKIEDGIWRMEVMPDAELIDNPFGRNHLDKIVSVIDWNTRNMNVNLENLGKSFEIKGINKDNNLTEVAKDGQFSISPGTYIVSRAGLKVDQIGDEKLGVITLNEFFAPSATVQETYVIHDEILEISTEFNQKINARIFSNNEIESAEVWFQNGNTYDTSKLEDIGNNNYTTAIPEKVLQNGFLEYRIIVKTDNGDFTFPGNIKGNPGDWNYYNTQNYKTRVVDAKQPINLFSAVDDREYIVGVWHRNNKLLPAKGLNEAIYQVNIDSLFKEDEENLNAEPLYDYSFRYNFLNKIKGRKVQLADMSKLIIKAGSTNNKTQKLQIALVDKNGASFGKIIDLDTTIKEHVIELNSLQPVKTVTLPRPYPTFLPYYFDHNNKGVLNINDVESIQISIGPGLNKDQLLKEQSIDIISVRLE